MSASEAVNFSTQMQKKEINTHFSRCEIHNNQSQTNCWLHQVKRIQFMSLKHTYV